MAELYAVMLALCTAVMFFGLFQMQYMLSIVMKEAEAVQLQSVLLGIQVAAIGLVATTFIMFVLLKKRPKQAREKNRENVPVRKKRRKGK
jgi:spore maturation protein SpmA